MNTSDPRPGQPELIRFTGMLAGRYRYVDFPGADPVLVEVAYEHGDCLVRFPPLHGDESAEIPLQDMAARENWREHFERVAG